MEMRENLKDLNMTRDEIDRFTKAFKDENFRKMLQDYAQEISDPENKKKYEEEIKLLEAERGISVEFIHPQPFRCLRTSVNGKQKCYVNVCSSDKIGKPESKQAVSEDGCRGLQWSLPHSLLPDREDRDPKGRKIKIYDVIFHPDTLHIARKNKQFMEVVNSAAIQGIQDTFKVTLDKNNLKEMSIACKGSPQPCVIRKPIPGFKTEQTEPLGFPYPGEEWSTTSSTKKDTESPTRENRGAHKLTIVQNQPHKTKEPTEPHYTVKYRSFIDLQDFRCSRDSAHSPRPKEIVVIVDVPLLKSVADTNLEVNGRNLKLETKEPAYRLEVVLAYPVDEDKGEAKFNKQRGQLTITLPVLTSNEAFDFTVGLEQEGSNLHTCGDEKLQGESDKTAIWTEREHEEDHKQQGVAPERQNEQECGAPERQNEQEGVAPERQNEQEGVAPERQNEQECGAPERQNEQECGAPERQKEQIEEILVNAGEESKMKLKEHKMQKEKHNEDKSEEEKKWKEEKNKEGGDEKENVTKQKRMDQQNLPREESAAEEKFRKNRTGCQNNTEEEIGMEGEEKWQGQEREVHEVRLKEEDEKSKEQKLKSGNKPEEKHPITSECAGVTGEEEQLNLDSCVESTTQTQTSDMQETENTKHNVKSKKESNAANLNQVSSKEPSMSAEELIQGSVKDVYEEDTDEDDLETQQSIQNPQGGKLPPACLREIDTDGNVKIISDHSTSAGFTFQNTLLYELD